MAEKNDGNNNEMGKKLKWGRRIVPVQLINKVTTGINMGQY